MTGKEIVAAAMKMKSYKYWYGGKRELATTTLAGQLKSEYPGVWTESYYQKALKDCDGKTVVADCSALVCGAYGMKDMGSYQIKNAFKEWTGLPRAGMIGWKRGHVGIFSGDGWDAKIIEMRGIDYDWQKMRSYSQCGFTAVLYAPGVDYGVGGYSAVGWHGDKLGWWYRHTYGTGAGTYYADCCKIINGHAYLFNKDGYIRDLAGHKIPQESSTGWIDS